MIVFWVLAASALASVAAVLAIPERSIDHRVARGLSSGADDHGERPSSLVTLLVSRPLMIFAAMGALFHLANGAMLGRVCKGFTGWVIGPMWAGCDAMN